MRGFVILVVLLMLAVISAVAVGQLSVVSSQTSISVRREEEAQARALAEGCLMLLQRHAERFMDGPDADFLPDSPPPRDFDRLLNPNGSLSRNGDEHIPVVAGGVSVEIPKGAPGGSEHQWLMIRRNGGACLLRYEDNSDDDMPANAALPDSTNDCRNGGTAEGAGTDINFCDQDGSVYLTAIGVFPALAATANDDVYAKAHARVTLRKLFQVATPGTFPAAIVAGGDVDIKNNITVCGVGGIAAKDVNGKFKGTSCICGSVQSSDPLGSTPPLGSACCATCAPGTASSGNPVPRQVDIDGDGNPCVDGGAPGCAEDPTESGTPESPLQRTSVPNVFLANNGFGDPLTTNNVIADPNICSFYLEDTGMVFYWDHSDTNANQLDTTLGLTLGTTLSGVPAGVENCQTYNRHPVDAPCTWDLAAVPPTVSCSSNETLCWRPMAKLGDGALTADMDFSPTRPAVPEFADATGNSLQIKAGPLPNARDTTQSLTAAPRLCGNLAAASGVNVMQQAAGSYTVLSAVTPSDLPTAILVAEKGITLQNKAARGAYQSLTLIAKEAINVGDNWNLSCAKCTGAIPTSTNLTTGPAGTCRIPVAGTPYALDTQTLIASTAATSGDNRTLPGFVVKTHDRLNWGSYTLAGLTYADGLYESVGGKSPCFVGRFVVDDNFNGLNNAVINIAGEWLVLGNLDGDANNITMTGDVYTESSAVFKNNWTMTGRLIANGNIEIKNSAIVTFDGGGATGTFGTNAVNTYMESQW